MHYCSTKEAVRSLLCPLNTTRCVQHSRNDESANTAVTECTLQHLLACQSANCTCTVRNRQQAAAAEAKEAGRMMDIHAACRQCADTRALQLFREAAIAGEQLLVREMCLLQ
eukprot:11489-Heterococcus_DN1.PRE.1